LEETSKTETHYNSILSHFDTQMHKDRKTAPPLPNGKLVITQILRLNIVNGPCCDEQQQFVPRRDSDPIENYPLATNDRRSAVGKCNSL
jgi:hypothetical protein